MHLCLLQPPKWGRERGERGRVERVGGDATFRIRGGEAREGAVEWNALVVLGVGRKRGVHGMFVSLPLPLPLSQFLAIIMRAYQQHHHHRRRKGGKGESIAIKPDSTNAGCKGWHQLKLRSG